MDQPVDAEPKAETSDHSREQAGGQELLNELNRLGNRLVELVDIAWNSDQRRQIEEDIKKGVYTVATALEDGVRQLSDTKPSREVIDAAEGVADTVSEKLRGSKAAGELASALAAGLHTLNDRMERLVRELESKRSASVSPPGEQPATPDRPQDIPIARGDETKDA
jgi:hypothetical protein